MRSITCPACATRVEKTMSWLKANSVVACPNCGRSIAVRRYKAQADAAAQFETLTGFAGDAKGT